MTNTAPDDATTRRASQQALDELFDAAGKYRTGRELGALFQFIRRLPTYAPYNAMLLHIQQPGTTFVAPASRWREAYQRSVKPNARPLVILQPRGPVMFVFDVADTEPLPDAPPLPREVIAPFETIGGTVGNRLPRLIEGAKRDGVRITEVAQGSQSAGSIRRAEPGHTIRLIRRVQGKEQQVGIPLRYEVLINEHLGPETAYATLVHELAHLYCGHLGTPDPEWWPERTMLDHVAREFEAEAVSHLVCRRIGIGTRSEEYLGGVLQEDDDARVPDISLDTVLKATGLIEQMSRGWMPLRPQPRAASAVQ